MNEKAYAFDDKIAAWHIGIALVALALGTWFGPLQAWEHARVNLYAYLAPGIQSYYQGLTLHAVLNALVWTTFFITGFFTYIVPRSLQRPLRYPWLNRLALIVMGVGLVMAAIPLLLNLATVLYTFYPPMKAHPLFYIGLTLVVVGSWIVGYNLYFTYGAWRRDNPGVRTPFLAFGALITMVMWQIATLGVAAEMLGMLIPWSLGLVQGTDPQLARTFFWFTGHPLVYFWLLPAYLSWYGMLPKQAGGKMFSDALARLAFWLFLLLSVPLGFHHQYVDPGVPAGWKFIHAVLTYSVAFPSLMTAFTVVASLEIGGRARGGKGLFGWIFKLPWKDPSYAAQNLAMIIFAFGGIGGLTNASYNVNLVVHNTSWVAGHFHLTVGTAVTLTFMGITYWLLPKMTGKELWSRKLALAQSWLWFFGMILLGNGLHILGLRFGVPRRTMLGAAPYASPEWTPFLIEVAIGGTLLFLSLLAYFINVLGTVFASRPLSKPVEMPVAEAVTEPQRTPAWLDRWVPWLAGAAVLIVLAYGPMLVQLIGQAQLTSPGFKVW
jgi:cytochrome c oxidase subunit 1